MIRSFVSVSLVLSTALVFASPSDRAVLAAMRISEVPNYSWTATVDEGTRSYIRQGKYRLAGSPRLVCLQPKACQFFTSNRRTADQGPEPPPLFARTRHHIVSVGSVLVLN